TNREVAAQARSLVHDERKRRGSVDRDALVADPHHAVAAHEASERVPGLLLHEHEIELAGVEPTHERAALLHGEFGVALRVELSEVPQHAGKLREGEVVGRTETESAAHR